MSVLLLIPDAYSSLGGIQAYMRRLAEILSDYATQRGAALDCVSLADSDYRLEAHPRAVAYGTFFGARGSKAAFARKAAEVARKRNPEIVVVGHTGLAPVAWGLHLAGIIPAYLLVLHGWEAWRRLETLGRMAASRAARIISTTSYTSREFCRLNGIPVERTCVIPLAVPVPGGDAPVSVTAVPARRRALKVLTVCRLVKGAGYKGIDTLIEAVAWVRDADVPIRLVVAGDGDQLSRWRRCVSELELDECVSFVGAISDGELQRLYRGCDVFALPSKGEGFGIVFLEAMAYGKPCIGGNHGGTPEVIEHGSDGFLVEHGDVEDLAGHLMMLAQDTGYARRMGERARRKVHDKFLFPHMLRRWNALLEQTESELALERGAPALPKVAGA